MILMALDDVRPGMIVGVGLRNREGHMLLGPGVALTAEHIARLRQLGYYAAWIDDADTRDIPYDDMLSEETRVAATAVIREAFDLTAREARKLRAISVRQIRRTLESQRFQQAFQDAGVVEQVTNQVDRIVRELLDRTVLTGLNSLRTHDSYSYHHCVDVAVTATVIGRLLGYDPATLKKLAAGCLLHDLGNLFVDAEILEKPGLLSPEELAQVKNHTVLGYLFLRDSMRVGVLSAHVAYQHHERQDGRGYPRGLMGTNRITQGPEIHLPGRITPFGEIAAIADFVDACSSDRPYRRRLPPDTVWAMTRDAAGEQLNREIVERFLKVLPPYPLGTQVIVTAGAWRGHAGVVARVNPRAMDRPVIRLLHGPAGARIAPVEIDLDKEPADIRGLVGSDGLLP
jgi:HD-GYP domain-containing protein (c-di-GMP phosphodiesterase class II)